MKFALTILATFIVSILALFAHVRIDLWLHPWVATIRDEDWYWYHYVLSVHAVTITYMKSWLWLIYPWIAAFLWTLGLMANSSDK